MIFFSTFTCVSVKRQLVLGNFAIDSRYRMRFYVDATCKPNLANISREFAPNDGLPYLVAGFNRNVRIPLGKTYL